MLLGWPVDVATVVDLTPPLGVKQVATGDSFARLKALDYLATVEEDGLVGHVGTPVTSSCLANSTMAFLYEDPCVLT